MYLPGDTNPFLVITYLPYSSSGIPPNCCLTISLHSIATKGNESKVVPTAEYNGCKVKAQKNKILSHSHKVAYRFRKL